MKRSLTSHIGVVYIGIALAFPVAGFSIPYSQMIVFGDSLSDNGNLASAAPGVLASMNYDARRVTDGPNTTPATSLVGVAVEQLNFALGLSPLLPATVGGSNYAWAFATTATNAPNLPQLVTPGTGTQVAAYLSTHPVASPDALYVVWAGANDLNAGTTPAQVAAAEAFAINNLTTQIGALLNSGARNILWFNLPDLSLTPRGAAQGAALNAQLHASSEQFRTDWGNSITQLQTLFPTASITGVDTYTLFNSIESNPGLYGFTNVTQPAQGVIGANPDTYVFWDSLHPTTKADSVVASYALAQLSATSRVPERNGSVDLVLSLMVVTVCGLCSRRLRQLPGGTAANGEEGAFASLRLL